MHVRVDELFGKRLDGLSSRDELGEHLGTVPFGFQHTFDTLELAHDFSHSRAKGLGLVFGMVVYGFCHGDSENGQKTCTKARFSLVEKGYGGMHYQCNRSAN